MATANAQAMPSQVTMPPHSTNGGAWEWRDERDRFVAFAFASADILIELDATGKIIFCDGATKSLMGVKTESMIGTPITQWVDDAEQEQMQYLIERPKALKRLDRLKINLTNQHTQKSVGFALSGYHLPYVNGHIFLTFGFIRRDIDATEIGMRDLTTGLYKQDAFAHKAVEAFKQAAAESKTLKISLLDLADLPELLLNYEVGDADILLESICGYLQQHAYSQDVAALIDDHAFAILHEADKDSETIADGLQQIYQTYVKDKDATIQHGTFELDNADLSDADCARALHYTINQFAKSHGEDFTIKSLHDGYQTMLAETVKRISTFHKTVEESRFDVALQPIVDIRNREIRHYEVLARLEDNNTFANPFDFITFGEEAGVIGDFDLAMCQKTINILRQAAEDGKYPLVSVNLSGLSLSSNLFRDTLVEMLNIHKDVRPQLMFEITESAKIHDLEDTNRFVQQLRKEGNIFCLDDFGVGESSFEYIRHLEVDYIKIDGSYVSDSINSPRGKHLLRAMIGLCHDLQIATIAERIEDEQTSQFLASCGVNFGQGYYYGKPSTDITAIIKQMRNTPLPRPGAQTYTKNKASRSWTDNLQSKY